MHTPPRYANNLMKSPVRYLAIPVYLVGEKKAESPKVGEASAPPVSRHGIDDIFGGNSLCVLDYVMEAYGGSFGEPLYMIIA